MILDGAGRLAAGYPPEAWRPWGRKGGRSGGLTAWSQGTTGSPERQGPGRQGGPEPGRPESQEGLAARRPGGEKAGEPGVQEPRSPGVRGAGRAGILAGLAGAKEPGRPGRAEVRGVLPVGRAGRHPVVMEAG